MKRHTVYMDDEEYKKIKYASIKDERALANFFKVSALKRAENIIDNLKNSGIHVDQEIAQIMVEEEIDVDD